jgi:hypothetical protein
MQGNFNNLSYSMQTPQNHQKNPQPSREKGKVLQSFQDKKPTCQALSA